MVGLVESRSMSSSRLVARQAGLGANNICKKKKEHQK